MLPSHWAESGDAGLPCEPNWDIYKVMANNGNVMLLMARDDDGAAVGYAVALLHPHMNSRRALVGTVATWYVRDGDNRAIIARRLLSKTRDWLIDKGAKQVTIETEYAHSAGRLLERMGFMPVKMGYRMTVPARSERQDA